MIDFLRELTQKALEAFIINVGQVGSYRKNAVKRKPPLSCTDVTRVVQVRKNR